MGFLSRAALTAACGMALAVSSLGVASAADYTLNVNTALTTSDPLYKGLEELQKNVEARSEGRLAIRLFPGSQLGKDEDVLEQLQDEMYDFFILSRQNEEVRRRLLDEVPMEDWAVALKGTEALLRRSIYAVMPKRQAQQLEAITARLGPVPVSRIEQIRREIMGIARELEEAGEIQLQLFAERTAE